MFVTTEALGEGVGKPRYLAASRPAVHKKCEKDRYFLPFKKIQHFFIYKKR